jgi:hypothetical protein
MKTVMEVVAFPSPGLRTGIPLLSAVISLIGRNSLQPLQCPKHDNKYPASYQTIPILMKCPKPVSHEPRSFNII